ncbi:MAG: DNA polymerase III subunit beta [Desulfobaccales bacterium]|jgi:DNA polymerase-3 subunit beta
MQVKINRETLLKGVGRTLGVVDRRGTMPILSNFLMQTETNQVRIAATDLEVSFRGFYPAEILEPGAVTIQAHYFFNLIKELPGDTLDLRATDKGGMKILAGDSRYQLNGLPADQFPPVPEIAEQNLVEVESHMVKEMIEKTIFSVSLDDLQYHLSSIFWERLEVDNGFLLRLISTDGHRLTLIERPLPGSENLSIEKGILIPRKGMAEVIRFLAEEEKVSLGLSTQSLALRADDHYLFIRLLTDKKFPEYRRIIPETFSYRFAINRREFAEAIKRISLLSSERFKGVILNLTSERVEVSFTNPEVGEGQETVPVFMEAGDPAGLPLEVGFNARYFTEPLNAMESEMVILELNDKDRPCRLVDQGDPHYFSIIMPMSL